MSPFGATATWRAGAATSAITFAQKPCGSVRPPLSASHWLRLACCADRAAADEQAIRQAVSTLSIASQHKSQIPNPKSQIPTFESGLLVLTGVVSDYRGDDQPQLIGLLDERVVGRFKKPRCAKDAQSQPGFLYFSQADPFFRPEVFATRAVVGFFRIRRG